MRKKILCAAAVAAAAAALVAGAASAQAMTLSFGKPTLSARVAITVPVTVTCSPFDPSLTYFSGGVSVAVEQAAGKAIAHGFGSASGSLPNLLFPCDDSQSTVPVTVLADPSGPPFHGGQAVFSAFGSAWAGISCGFPGCYYNQVEQGGSAGPTTLTVH
jgi:hypothetical protein